MDTIWQAVRGRGVSQSLRWKMSVVVMVFVCLSLLSACALPPPPVMPATEVPSAAPAAEVAAEKAPARAVKFDEILTCETPPGKAGTGEQVCRTVGEGGRAVLVRFWQQRGPRLHVVKLPLLPAQAKAADILAVAPFPVTLVVNLEVVGEDALDRGRSTIRSDVARPDVAPGLELWVEFTAADMERALAYYEEHGEAINGLVNDVPGLIYYIFDKQKWVQFGPDALQITVMEGEQERLVVAQEVAESAQAEGVTYVNADQVDRLADLLSEFGIAAERHMFLVGRADSWGDPAIGMGP